MQSSARADGTTIICRLGSVKTNIGHTESAAGVAGLIKVALALKHGIIPKSLHFVEPNPHIPWADAPTVGADGGDRVARRRRMPIAGVSAFGISGTNAHVVLQAHRRVRRAANQSAADRVRLLPLSAQSEALSDIARRWSSG